MLDLLRKVLSRSAVVKTLSCSRGVGVLVSAWMWWLVVRLVGLTSRLWWKEWLWLVIGLRL